MTKQEWFEKYGKYVRDWRDDIYVPEFKETKHLYYKKFKEIKDVKL